MVLSEWFCCCCRYRWHRLYYELMWHTFATEVSFNCARFSMGKLFFVSFVPFLDFSLNFQRTLVSTTDRDTHSLDIFPFILFWFGWIRILKYWEKNKSVNIWFVVYLIVFCWTTFWLSEKFIFNYFFTLTLIFRF